MNAATSDTLIGKSYTVNERPAAQVAHHTAQHGQTPA